MIYLTDGKRHLICIPYSIENLHKMAEDLEIGRHWFHRSHYDIPKNRQKEIEDRALMTNTRDIVKVVRDYHKEINE